MASYRKGLFFISAFLFLWVHPNTLKKYSCANDLHRRGDGLFDDWYCSQIRENQEKIPFSHPFWWFVHQPLTPHQASLVKAAVAIL